MIERFEKFSAAISEISRCWHKIATKELEKYKFKGTHAVYLTILYNHEEGITAAALGELARRDKADVSRAIAELEKKGIVLKDSVNRGSYRALLKLTDLGREISKNIVSRAVTAVKYASFGVSQEKREVFYEVLENIVDNLNKLSQEGLPAQ